MQYQDLRNGRFYLGDNVEVMRSIPEGVIDLTVTSPPYDNLRKYTGESEWNWEKFTQVAQELYRITKNGGVVVWNVADATVKGNETGTSFRQALYFKDKCGFNLFDTMIFEKAGTGACGSRNGYWQAFEYMFVLTKGKHTTFNAITIPGTKTVSGGTRNKKEKGRDDSNRRFGTNEQRRTNIWRYAVGGASGDVKTNHPAVFVTKMAVDHIISWSNAGEVVFDPFMGSGTTACAAIETNRKWVGIEVAQEYANEAIERIKAHVTKDC